MESHYKKALESARAEYHRLIDQRSEIEHRLNRLVQTIKGLEALVGDTDHPKGLSTSSALGAVVGFSDAIRAIIDRSTKPIKPTEIRDILTANGFDPSDYSNMLTVIHNTLARLEKQHQIQPIRVNNDLLGWVPWPERQKTPGDFKRELDPRAPHK